MTTVAEAFETCRRRLEITKTEQADAIRRQQEVRGHIQNGFDIARDFLTGSYARHTKTKPLKDVDIFFVLGPKESERRSNSPRSVLDAFETELRKHYSATQIERGRRSIAVIFDRLSPTQDDDGKVLSIDVVPAFAIDDYYEIPDDVAGEWIRTNPEVHAKRATAKNEEFASRWKPLVKMLKGWNRETGKPIKPSFLIEVMALKLVDPPFNAYSSDVRSFFAAAAEAIGDDWADPAGIGPLVSDQMTPERCQEARHALYEAEKTATRAARAEDQGRCGEAIALWRQLFGPYFPAR